MYYNLFHLIDSTEYIWFIWLFFLLVFDGFLRSVREFESPNTTRVDS